MTYSKTKTTYYRRIYVAYLIDKNINTVPLITEYTGMPRRTAQDTILALNDLDIECRFVGAKKDGKYKITSWGAIQKEWIKKHLKHVKDVLYYN